MPDIKDTVRTSEAPLSADIRRRGIDDQGRVPPELPVEIGKNQQVAPLPASDAALKTEVQDLRGFDAENWGAPEVKEDVTTKAKAPQQDGAEPGQRTDEAGKPAGWTGGLAGLASRAVASAAHATNVAAEAVRYAVGQLNAVDMLINQHRETDALLKRIADTKDPESRHRLLEMLCDSLIGHMRIEEEIFYPAMQREGVRTSERVLNSENEHHHAKELMTDLLKLNAAQAEFDDKFADISEALRFHMKEEEEVFFPAAKEQVDAKKLKELGNEMHKRFGELTSQKNPRNIAFEDVGKKPPTEDSTKKA